MTFSISDFLKDKPNSPTIWIGLKNNFNEGLRWVDDSVMTFFNWNKGEPSRHAYEECGGNRFIL